MSDDQGVRECCKKKANAGPVERVSNEITFRRCKECGRRHFEMIADPGKWGLKLSGIS